MLKYIYKSSLALGIAALVIQFATPATLGAAEVSKTVQSSDPVAILPPAGQLPTALLGLTSTTGAFSQYAFLVDKRARTLTVWQTTPDDKLKLVGAWPTDIGEKEGDKLIQGDRRTPEGIYFFQTTQDGRKVDFSQYGVRIFTLDYPNYFDRLEKKSGNGIWFHAIPETKSLLRGSRGCVVVRNAVIEELAKYIDLKRTPMLITNHVDYVSPEEWQKDRSNLTAWLEAWRASWTGKDLEAYMAQYSARFRGNRMDKAHWRKYKQNLADRYKFIDIKLQDVQIFNQGPKVVFRFLQNYKSDAKEDFGTKMIYALKNPEANDKFEIVGETWEEFKPMKSTAEAISGNSAQ